jgi:hypothetical protein
VILLIVLFAPGGILGIIDRRIRAARSGAIANGDEPGAAARGADPQP